MGRKKKMVRGKSYSYLFKKGHTGMHKAYMKYSGSDTTDHIAESVESLSIADEEPSIAEITLSKCTALTSNTSHLGIRTRSISASEDSDTQYFFASTTHLNELFNRSAKGHMISHSDCIGNLVMVKHQQRLLSTSWYMKCDTCEYVGDAHSMTDKKDLGPGMTGPKPSTLNEALGFALLKSSIGGTQFRELMLSLGVLCGSSSGIQSQINKCGKVLSVIAEQNMAYERMICRNDPDLGISLDGWYTTKYSTGPWQASSQTAFTAMAARTMKVLALIAASKLCPQATKLRNMGIEVDCPNNHENCTANLSKYSAIGQEGYYASEVGNILKKEGLDVSHFCSDADSKTKNGFLKVYPNAQHYLDKNHLSRSLKRGLVNAKYSKNMFNVKTAKAKARAKTRFAGDLKYRVESEFRTYFKTLKKGTLDEKVNKMTEHVSNLIPTVIECFKGNHQMCLKYSRICSKTSKWKLKHKIKPSKLDEAVIKKVILNKRLGPACLQSTIRDISTQSNEAFNRTLSKVNPKTVTNAVNFTPRMHAAVLLHNLGSAQCSITLLNAAGHKVSKEVKHNILMMEKANNTRKSIAQSAKGKQKRAKLRNYRQKLHDEKYDEPDQKLHDEKCEDRYEKDVNLPC